MEHEERERQGGEASVGQLADGTDHDDNGDVCESEQEVPVEVVHFSAAAGAKPARRGGGLCEGESAKDEEGEADETEDGGGDADYWFR